MKDDKAFWIIIGMIVALRVFRKPVTKAVWSLYTGPKFYAAVKDDLTSNDPARIARLHEAYKDWPIDTQTQFNTTVRKLGLRRPW